MNRALAEQLIRAYVEGWKAGNRATILSTLATNCVITECYGPVYRGIERVAQWIDAWFAPGNTIETWDVTSLILADAGAAAEWRFSCTYNGTRASFDGCSIVRVAQGKITYLREYQTSAPLYDWEGQWRP